MHWFRAHPYLATVLGALFLVLIGALIVADKSAVDPRNSGIQAWGGIGGDFSDPIAAAARPDDGPINLYTEVRSGAPFVYNTQPLPVESGSEEEEGDSDLEQILASLVTGGSSASLDIDSDLLDAYSFIPSGQISTEQSPTKPLTSSQQALYEWGNEAGSIIQAFEETHRSMPQVLKDQFEDPTDAGKNARLKELATSLANVGRALEEIYDAAPPQVKPASRRLADSYKEIGGKLALIPNATNEKSLVDAMLTYNAAVEVFVKNYVALATLFSASGVTFRSDEAGSIFTFTAATL